MLAMLQTVATYMAPTSPPPSTKHPVGIELKRLSLKQDLATNGNCLLLRLPTELQGIIESLLPLPAATVFKYTCRNLYRSGTPTTELHKDLQNSPDERYEYLCQLGKDNLWPNLLTCAKCKMLHYYTAFSISSLTSTDRHCTGSSSHLEIHPNWTLDFPSFTNLIRTLQPLVPIDRNPPGLTRLAHPCPAPLYHRSEALIAFNNLSYNNAPDLNPTHCHNWYRTDDRSYEVHSAYHFSPMQSIQSSKKAKLSASAICEELMAGDVKRLCPHMNIANAEVVRALMAMYKEGQSVQKKNITFVVYKPRILSCPVCQAKCTVSLHQYSIVSRPLAVLIVVERRLGKGKSAIDPLWIMQLKI